MMFNVNVSDRVAVITSSTSGRYITIIDAIEASIKAAYDINIQTIIYNDKVCRLTDDFTGGFKQNSLIIKELAGLTIKDRPLWLRFYSWVKETLETLSAREKFSARMSNGNPVELQKKYPLGGSLSISTRNCFHPYRCGRKQ